jgi:hypothetical protein
MLLPLIAIIVYDEFFGTVDEKLINPPALTLKSSEVLLMILTGIYSSGSVTQENNNKGIIITKYFITFISIP